MNVWTLIIGGSVVLIAWLSFVPGPADKVVFLDVGQGDAILLQDGTAQVLIDGGPGMAVLQRLAEEMPWFDRRIEVVVSTHADRDHLEGLLHVLERYDVGLVLLPRWPHDSQLQEAWLKKLLALTEQKRVDYQFAWAGQEVRMSDELAVSLLGPWSEQGEIYAPGEKANNAAVLARADFSGMSFLLTSDAEAPVENVLVKREGERLDVDVLKAGHHGSKTSTTQALLNAALPSAAVISVGKDNRYGHPHPDVLERLRGINLWRTDENGSVQFLRNGERWFVVARE